MNRKLAKTIGEAAHIARRRLELTQAALAERLDISSTVYSRLERGEMLPSVQTLARLCSELNVSTDVMLGLSHENAAPKAAQEQLPLSSSSLHRLLTLVLRMNEEQLRALISVAKAMLR